jgi:prepilin peptidase CpaA
MALGAIPQLNVVVLLLPFLVVAMGTDIARRRIPNPLIAVMLGCGIVFQSTYFGTSGLLSSLGGVVVGLSMLLPFYALGGMGAGDVKLLAAVGGFLGPGGALVAGALALVAGGVLALAALTWRGLRALSVRRFSAEARASSAEAKPIQLPYSLAVATGSLMAAYQLGLASLALPTLKDLTAW